MIFDYVPKNSYPLLSWIFCVPLFAALGAAVWFAARYWIGPAYDSQCGCGNVMYRDPIDFAFTALMICMATLCLTLFMMWHGPFKRSH